MTTSVYFNQAVKTEQDLYEDIIIESLKIYGQDVFYLPRDTLAANPIFNEEVKAAFGDAYQIEMYIENVEGFEGEGDLISKFGFELRDQATFIVAKRRWQNLVGFYNDGITSDRPAEGDVIYLPMSNSFFEIRFVEHEQPFYQLKNLPIYKLQCELFEYNGQTFDTGVDMVDEQIYTRVNQITVKVETVDGEEAIMGEDFRQNIPSSTGHISGKLIDYTFINDTTLEFHLANWVTSDGEYHEFYPSDSAYLTGQDSSSQWKVLDVYNIDSDLEDVAFKSDIYAKNQEFESEGNNIIDFSETNPFGDPS